MLSLSEVCFCWGSWRTEDFKFINLYHRAPNNGWSTDYIRARMTICFVQTNFHFAGLLVGHVRKAPEKIRVSRQKAFSLLILGFCHFYLLGISSSSYYSVICNILMGQKRDHVTEPKFLRLVHKTGNSLKFILSPVQPFYIIFKTSSNKFTNICFAI